MIRNQFVTLSVFALCGIVAISAVQLGCRTRYEMRIKWTEQGGLDTSLEFTRCGRCIEQPATGEIECDGGVIVDNECICLEGTHLDNGTCMESEIECNGGDIVDNECVCPEITTLVNGTCKLNTVVESCENGEWNAKEQRCDCQDGYELIDGVCLQSTPRTCYFASQPAYAPGTMDCAASPLCTADELLKDVRMPTRNPRTYWHCFGVGVVSQITCITGTCFSYARQACIHWDEWKNECNS